METDPTVLQTKGVSVLNRTLDGVLAVRQSVALGQRPKPDILDEAENSIIDALILIVFLRKER